MKVRILLIAFSIAFFSIAGAVVPNLYIDGIIVDPSLRRINSDSENLRFTFNSNIQQWSLLSDVPLNGSTRPTFGIYTQGNGPGFNNSIIFNGMSGNGRSVTTNFNSDTDVGFWLANDLNSGSIAGGRNSVFYSERYLSIGDKLNDTQSFIMYDVRNLDATEYSFGSWSGSGDYDYLLFIEDKGTDGIDHDDMVVGMMVAPEPGTLILLGSGLIGTGLALRRRKK